MSNEIPATTMRQLRSVLIRWAILLGLIGVFAVWATWRMSTAASRLEPGAVQAQAVSTGEVEIEHWTCTMHPEVQQAEAGDCPICGMELVPKYLGSDEPGVKPAAPHSVHTSEAQPEPAEAWYRCTMPECGDQGSSDPESRCPVCGMKREAVDVGGDDAGEFTVQMSERARRLAEVETEPAQPRMLFKRIRTVGRVGYDETRYKMVSAWTGGRIDKLFADFTGMTVTQGDHLVEIYSPELLSAQEEYLQAFRAAQASSTSVARRSSEQILSAARRKLELLGVTAPQLASIERSGQPQTHLVIHAPIGGTILDRKIMEGMYVKTGDPLYTIADLRQLWLLVDLYESDLPWVKPFQQVSVTARSLPGEVFQGEIMFVDPKVDPQTRTVQVRIHVDNAGMRLKPDMWVRAELKAALAAGGAGAVPTPGGAYACPMHPWETADELATCPICEMNMVALEDLPQHAAPTDAAALLSVPRDAVMQTGERALVYVETEPGVYRGQEISVGPLSQAEDGGEYYPVLAGLAGSEQVVTRGNFAIDSQMQLSGKPSLLGSAVGSGHQHAGHAADATEDKQTRCPVMGGEIDEEVYTDLHGVRVYFCCPPCIQRFEDDPEEYMDKLPATVRERLQKAMRAESAQQTRCPVMGGEIDEEVYTDLHGIRVYFCCPPCIQRFEDDPREYLPKLPAALQKRLLAALAKEQGDD